MLFKLPVTLFLAFLLLSCSHARKLSNPELIEQTSDNLKKDQVGYLLYSLDEGKIVESYQSDKLFMTASTTKLITAYAALSVLGENHQFETSLYLFGKQGEKGVFHGDLYLVGGGDPLLTSKDLDLLSQKLKNLGIHTLKGRFFYDDSIFPSFRRIDLSEEKTSYNVPISGLSCNFNQFLSDAPIAHSASLIFKKMALSHGVHLPLPRIGHLPPSAKAQKVASLMSSSVLEIVSVNLEFSNNLISEMLLLHVAKTLRPTQKITSLREASLILRDWYKKQGFLYPDQDWTIVNGSGLSTQNKMTPKAMVSFLKFFEGPSFQGRPFWKLTPISGSRGTLRRFFPQEELRHKVWAKTGSFFMTKALAGSFISNSSKRYLFALFVVNPTGRATLYGRAQGDSWNMRTKKKISSLFMRWLDRY